MPCASTSWPIMGDPTHQLDDRPMKLLEHLPSPKRQLHGPSLLCTSLLPVLNRFFHRSYTTLEMSFCTTFPPTIQPSRVENQFFSHLQLQGLEQHFSLACAECFWLNVSQFPSLFTYPPMQTGHSWRTTEKSLAEKEGKGDKTETQENEKTGKYNHYTLFASISKVTNRSTK